MIIEQPSRRRLLVAAGASAALGCAPALSRAAQPTQVPGVGPYPSRPIRVIVPLAPGGGADIVARIVSDRFAQQVGVPVVVENRAGGGTVIGATDAAKAAPDGYTLLWGTSTTHAINASLVKNLPYDPLKDFEPIGLAAVLPLVLVVNPSVPVNSLQELVAYAKKHPGELNFGSAGNGSTFQLAGEMLNEVAGIRCMHIPYKGAALAMTDLLGGQIQFMFTTIPPALPYIQNGKLKALATANSKRSSLLPQLPTTAEAGAPGVDASAWNGYMAPAGTPRPIIERLSRDLGVVIAQPDIIEKLHVQGVEPLYNKPAEFAEFIRSETARYAKVIKQSNTQIN